MRIREILNGLQRAIVGNKRLTAVLIAVVFAVVISTSILGHEASERDRSNAFSRVADQVSERMARQAPLWAAYTGANRDLIALNGTPNPIEIRAYEERLKERFSSVQSATFISRVSDQERLEHELLMRRQGLDGYEIRVINPQMEFVRSPRRPEYFPTYIQDLEGWDVSSDPRLASIIDSLRDSGEQFAGMFTHPLGISSEMGLVVFNPIYDGQSIPDTLEERRFAFSGISIISLSPGILIAGVVGDLEGEISIEVTIEATDRAPSVDRPLYVSTGFDSSLTPQKEDQILLFGDAWNFQIRATDGLRGSWPSWVYPFISATAGLAALMGGLLILILVQRQKDAIEASERLRELGEVKDQFLSTISHELKTPLTSIQAFTDILRNNRSDHFDKRELSQLDIISKNSARLNVLINDVLDVSSLHSGTFRLNTEEFEVEELLSEIESSFEPILSRRNQSLKRTMGFGRMALTADKNRIAQVLSNLISNASKYSTDGSIITFSAIDIGSQLQVTVTDSGMGMSRDDLEQVGTPFFRVDSEQSRKVGGTGLGIYICQSIVDLHDGEFSILSEPDKGTTVTLILPGLHEWHPPTEEPSAPTYRSRFDDLRTADA